MKKTYRLDVSCEWEDRPWPPDPLTFLLEIPAEKKKEETKQLNDETNSVSDRTQLIVSRLPVFFLNGSTAKTISVSFTVTTIGKTNQTTRHLRTVFFFFSNRLAMLQRLIRQRDNGSSLVFSFFQSNLQCPTCIFSVNPVNGYLHQRHSVVLNEKNPLSDRMSEPGGRPSFFVYVKNRRIEINSLAVNFQRDSMGRTRNVSRTVCNRRIGLR